MNEVYLTHTITAVEGKKKGPGAMQDGAILNKIKNIEKPNIDDLDPNQSFQVSVTKMASIQVTAKLNWFSQQKRKGISGGSLRSDQQCMLVSAGYIVAEAPGNLKKLDVLQVGEYTPFKMGDNCQRIPENADL